MTVHDGAVVIGQNLEHYFTKKVYKITDFNIKEDIDTLVLIMRAFTKINDCKNKSYQGYFKRILIFILFFKKKG